MRLIIDGLTQQDLEHAQLYQLLFQYLLFGITAVIFSRLLRKIPLKLSHKAEYHLRKDIFAHLTRLDSSYYRTQRTGDLMTRLSSDINMVRDAIGQGLLQGIRTIVVLFSALIVMLLTDVQLALIVYALYIPMVIIFFLILRIMRRRQKELQEKTSELSSFAQESFSGIRCLKGFALEERRNQQFTTLNQGLIRKNMLMQATRQSLWPFMAFWFGVGMILILNVGGRRIIDGQLTLGTLTQFIQYLLYMQWPLLALSWTSSLYQRGVVSWGRVREMMEAQPNITDSTNPHTEPLPHHDITFHNVSLQLDNRPLIQHLNLTIPTGTTLGITGPTGCGKSLLAALTARLIDPTEGHITLGSIPLPELPLDTIRQKIGCALQEPILFSRTLEHNLAFGLSQPNPDRIAWATQTAHLDQDIQRFPDQLQTLLGERGVTLSGGQRQRTAIARAIARQPEILILDDVLSAVDTQTEAAIMQKLKPIIDERTTLFISHRISTLQYADTIIVIEDGQITQQGSHQQLLQQSGYYAQLHAQQNLKQQLEQNP
ncbi:MAG: ABC transporter ATP-binding protein [Kiritimatiellaceae bacterium]|nr:MAG: ABC transporter ATP-binding protein [Kiritimatiellaceae bacterium]